MQPDELSSRVDDVAKDAARRPAPSRLRAWLGPASLGLLFVATSWAVAVYASPWLVVPYGIAMAVLVGAPSRDKSTKAASSAPKDIEDRFRTPEVPPRPVLADLGPSTVVEDSENPDWEKESDPASDPSTPKTKKGKSRSRKAKAPTAMPARVEPAPAVWVQVEPGKFIRADALHPRAPEVQEPAAPIVTSFEVVDRIEIEVSELPSPELPSSTPTVAVDVVDRIEIEVSELPSPELPSSTPTVAVDVVDPIEIEVSEPFDLDFQSDLNSPGLNPNERERLGETLDVVPLPTIDTASDDAFVIDSPFIPNSIQDASTDTAISEDAWGQGNAPQTQDVELTGPSPLSDEYVAEIDEVVAAPDSETFVDWETEAVANSDVEHQHLLTTTEDEETVEDSEAEEPWNLETKESGFEGDDEPPLVQRLTRPNPYGSAGPRFKGRRRGLVEAGLYGGGDRSKSNRNSPGTSRANRRSGRWAAQGRPSRAGRSHPPRSPPRRRRRRGSIGLIRE